MRGNNDLILNHGTVIEALQEYFDKRMGEYSPQIVCVQAKGDTIVVSTSSPKKEGL